MSVKIKMETSRVSERGSCLQQGREYEVSDELATELIGNKQAVAVGKPPRSAVQLNQKAKANAVA